MTSSHNKNLEPFFNIHAGKSGILFATGPTVNSYKNIDEIETDAILVGVNSIYNYPDVCNKLTYYFFGSGYEESEDYRNNIKAHIIDKGIKSFASTYRDGNPTELGNISPEHAIELGTNLFDCNLQEFAVDIANNSMLGHSIVFPALQFMLYTGVKTIYLVGCDVTGVDDNTEWWRMFKPFVEKEYPGVRIINIKPVGLKGLFEEYKIIEPKNIIFGDPGNFGYSWTSVDKDSEADIVINFGVDTLSLPLEDEAYDLIYTSHVIQHMKDSVVAILFKEFYRILKKGGGIRIVAPDSKYFIDSYLGDKKAFFENEYGGGTGRTWEQEVSMCVNMFNLNKDLLKPHNLLTSVFCSYSDVPNDAPIFNEAEVNKNVVKMNIDDFISWCTSYCDKDRPGGHVNGFYLEKTEKMLKEVGFLRIKQQKFRESKFNVFNNNSKFDLDLRKTFSFYVDAEKC